MEPMIGCTINPVTGPAKPENRHVSRACAEVGVDPAHVGELETPAKLNPEEPETHVEDLPETKSRFVHGDSPSPLDVPAQRSGDGALG